MFSDPFSAVMALILLAFIGTIAIFFRIWRELDALRRMLGDIRESLQYYAVDSAQQNRDLASLVKELRGLAPQQDAPAREPADLGTLLEKGLPSLMENSSIAVSRPTHESGYSRNFSDGDEEDFLRRFETGPGKGAS